MAIFYGRFVPSGIFRRMKWPPCWAPPSRSSAVTKPRSVFRLSVVTAFAQKLGLPVAALSGEEPILPPELTPVSGRRRVPILGSAACGEPIYSPGDGTDYITVEDDLPCDFALIAEGDSMIGDRIHSGDVVFLRSQDHVQDGEIAAVGWQHRVHPASPLQPGLRPH